MRECDKDLARLREAGSVVRGVHIALGDDGGNRDRYGQRLLCRLSIDKVVADNDIIQFLSGSTWLKER